MTRFRLFILLTYTAVLPYSKSAPIQRCAALSPLLPTENQFFTARTHFAYEGDDGYQPTSSFVNSSRERSLSSTLSYPSLRCNLHLFTLSPIPCRGRDQRDAGSRARTHTHTFQMALFMAAVRSFSVGFAGSPTLLLQLLLG